MVVYHVRTAKGHVYWIDSTSNEWMVDTSGPVSETRGVSRGIVVSPRTPQLGDRLLLQWTDAAGKMRLARTSQVVYVDSMNDEEEVNA